MKITLDISENALKKLRTQATTKRLLGADHMSLSDLFLLKVIEALDEGKEVCTIKTKGDGK